MMMIIFHTVPGLFGSRLKTCDWHEKDQRINESRCDDPENWLNDWLDDFFNQPLRYIKEKIGGTWWNQGSVFYTCFYLNDNLHIPFPILDSTTQRNVFTT